MYDKRVGLVAGDQSAACLAQVIFGHVGGEVYTEKRIHVSEILTFGISNSIFYGTVFVGGPRGRAAVRLTARYA